MTILVFGTRAVPIPGTGTFLVPLMLVLFHSVLTNLSNTKTSHNKTYYIITYGMAPIL